jgi:hypothetical protein
VLPGGKTLASLPEREEIVGQRPSRSEPPSSLFGQFESRNVDEIAVKLGPKVLAAERSCRLRAERSALAERRLVPELKSHVF